MFNTIQRVLSKLSQNQATRIQDHLMFARGIRGATIVEHNVRTPIIEATVELLGVMVQDNDVPISDIVAVFFTTTNDLNAEFPAVAARETLGWTSVPLMCGHEMTVPGSMEKVVRIMMLVNTPKNQDEINHVYLRGAGSLRSD